MPKKKNKKRGGAGQTITTYCPGQAVLYDFDAIKDVLSEVDGLSPEALEEETQKAKTAAKICRQFPGLTILQVRDGVPKLIRTYQKLLIEQGVAKSAQDIKSRPIYDMRLYDDNAMIELIGNLSTMDTIKPSSLRYNVTEGSILQDDGLIYFTVCEPEDPDALCRLDIRIYCEANDKPPTDPDVFYYLDGGTICDIYRPSDKSGNSKQLLEIKTIFTGYHIMQNIPPENLPWHKLDRIIWEKYVLAYLLPKLAFDADKQYQRCDTMCHAVFLRLLTIIAQLHICPEPTKTVNRFAQKQTDYSMYQHGQLRVYTKLTDIPPQKLNNNEIATKFLQARLRINREKQPQDLT